MNIDSATVPATALIAPSTPSDIGVRDQIVRTLDSHAPEWRTSWGLRYEKRLQALTKLVDENQATLTRNFDGPPVLDVHVSVVWIWYQYCGNDTFELVEMSRRSAITGESTNTGCVGIWKLVRKGEFPTKTASRALSENLHLGGPSKFSPIKHRFNDESGLKSAMMWPQISVRFHRKFFYVVMSPEIFDPNGYPRRHFSDWIINYEWSRKGTVSESYPDIELLL